MNRLCLGFAGLTHLGLVTAAAAAAKGFQVIGCDFAPGRAAAIAAGRLPVAEPGLADLVRAHRARLTFADQPQALAGCDVVVVASDVPTDATGESQLAGIAALIDQVMPAMKPDAVLVVLCQVPPGFTRRLGWPAGRLYYQVETLIFGRAVERATRPERIVVGCADPKSPLAPAYGAYLKAFDCPVLPMGYESAELAKIAINCCLAASVTVANTLAEICERIGADWSEIAPALKLDRRIGPHAYLGAGLGLAGGNLERDLSTVLRLASETGVEAGVVRAFAANSRHRRDWALRLLHSEVFDRLRDPIVGVLGLAYKEDTDSTKNSPALALIAELGPWRVRVFDPVVPASAIPQANVTAVATALEAARGADALAIMTPWPIFREIDPARLAATMNRGMVLDPYRVLDGSKVAAAGLDYHTLGRSPLRARA